MKYNIFASSMALGATLALLGCGDGDECRVVANDDGSATILCTDGSKTEIPRPASGKPPETCAVVDIGEDRFVRCGDIDYPIGTTSPLCPSGFFEGDVALSATDSSGVDDLTLSGCTKLKGNLWIDAGVVGSDPRGSLDPSTLEIPESVLGLREIHGDIRIENFIGTGNQGFANLTRVVPPGGMSEGFGEIYLWNSDFNTATVFPVLEVVSGINLQGGEIATLEFPSAQKGKSRYYDTEDDSDITISVWDSALHTLRFPSATLINIQAQGSTLRDVQIPRIERGGLYFALESNGTLSLPSAPVESVWGRIYLLEFPATLASWEAILPNVEFLGPEQG